MKTEQEIKNEIITRLKDINFYEETSYSDYRKGYLDACWHLCRFLNIKCERTDAGLHLQEVENE